MQRALPGLLALWIASVGACRAQEDAGSGAAPTETALAAPTASSETQPEAQSTPPVPQKPFYKKIFTTQAFLATVPGALLQTWHDWPNEWGTHRLGFEKRAASLYGQFVIGSLIEDGVKLIHHEDTRYVRLGQGNFFRRTAHAVTGTLVARRPDGNPTPAYSLVANAYGSWAVATLWSPREYRTPSSILEWGSTGLAVTVVADALREFWPDLKGVLHKKK